MLGARLMARQKNGIGQPLADTEDELARQTLAELYHRSGLALMDAALAHDGAGEAQASTNPLLSGIYRPDANAAGGLVALSLGLRTGLVALGASAGTHYPHVAGLMGVDLTVPDHADVAGAVGAAAGTVRQRVVISVTQPAEGRFRIHLPDGPKDLGEMEAALAHARDAAAGLARMRAKNAGAKDVEVTLDEDVKLVPISSERDMFLEALIYATADGHAG